MNKPLGQLCLAQQLGLNKQHQNNLTWPDNLLPYPINLLRRRWTTSTQQRWKTLMGQWRSASIRKYRNTGRRLRTSRTPQPNPTNGSHKSYPTLSNNSQISPIVQSITSNPHNTGSLQPFVTSFADNNYYNAAAIRYPHQIVASWRKWQQTQCQIPTVSNRRRHWATPIFASHRQWRQPPNMHLHGYLNRHTN